MKKWIHFLKMLASQYNWRLCNGRDLKKLLLFTVTGLAFFNPCIAQELPNDILSAVYKIKISFNADGLFYDIDNPDFPIENIGCGQKGGTGYVISPDGYLLTAHHVAGIRPGLRRFMEEAIITYSIKKIDTVYLNITATDINGHKYIGKVTIVPTRRLGFFTDNFDIRYFQNKDEVNDLLLVSEDRENDLSLLKINKSEVNYLNFADSDILKIGDKVFAIGCPETGRYKVAPGEVLSKSILVKNEFNELRGIQTSAKVIPGFSGGPLINDQYNVVGMVFAGKTDSYAVPTSVANIIYFREMAKESSLY